MFKAFAVMASCFPDTVFDSIETAVKNMKQLYQEDPNFTFMAREEVMIVCEVESEDYDHIVVFIGPVEGKEKFNLEQMAMVLENMQSLFNYTAKNWEDNPVKIQDYLADKEDRVYHCSQIPEKLYKAIFEDEEDSEEEDQEFDPDLETKEEYRACMWYPMHGYGISNSDPNH